MDLNYSDDDLAFRARARSWLEANLPADPRPPEGADAARWDMAWQAKLASGGFAGLNWPKDYGGAGLDGDHLMPQGNEASGIAA